MREIVPERANFATGKCENVGHRRFANIKVVCIMDPNDRIIHVPSTPTEQEQLSHPTQRKISSAAKRYRGPN